MARSYEDYRTDIELLDRRIETANSIEEKIRLIDDDIVLNNGCIRTLKKPIPAKIVWCVLLSVFFLLGLFIFLPQILSRSVKIKACKNKICYLEALKFCLTEFPNCNRNDDAVIKAVEQYKKELSKEKGLGILFMIIGLSSLILGILFFIAYVSNIETVYLVLALQMIPAGGVMLGLREKLFVSKARINKSKIKLLTGDE